MDRVSGSAAGGGAAAARRFLGGHPALDDFKEAAAPLAAALPAFEEAPADLGEKTKLTAALELALNQLMQREVVTPDGVYGPRTRTALTDFQSLFGLPAEGDVGDRKSVV